MNPSSSSLSFLDGQAVFILAQCPNILEWPAPSWNYLGAHQESLHISINSGVLPQGLTMNNKDVFITWEIPRVKSSLSEQ